jgi:hypothetical protein
MVICKFEIFNNVSKLKPLNIDAKVIEANYDPFSI